MKKFTLFVLLLVGCGWWYVEQQEIEQPPGVLVPEPPSQINLPEPIEFSLDQYLVRKLAAFDATGRILGIKRYRSDNTADISPYDFAMGWGPMSDSAVLEEISISQSNRWYFWKVDQFPIPRNAIEHNSANMHLIPADQSILREIKERKVGEVIRIQGYLVEAINDQGKSWKSSLSRTDTGDKACEIIFVESLQPIH